MLKYNKVKLNLLDRIARSRLCPGDLLPPEMILSEELAISRDTLRHALGELETEGLIEKQQGRGSILLRALEDYGDFAKIFCLDIWDPANKDIPLSSSFQQQPGFMEHLKKNGLTPVFLNTSTFSNHVVNAAADCVGILVMGSISREWLNNLRMLGLRTIVIGANPFPRLLPTITYDWKGLARSVANALIKRGHRSIGLINGAQNYLPAIRIFKGYCEALEEAGIGLDSALVRWGSSSADVNAFVEESLLHCDALLLEHGAYRNFLGVCWQRRISPVMCIGVADSYQNERELPHGDNLLLGSFPCFAHISAVDALLAFARNEPWDSEHYLIKGEVLS